jgi:hypothetical protein
VHLTNLSATLANYCLVAFGTSAANAEANLAVNGLVVTAGTAAINPVVYGVPVNATHIAYKSAAATPSLIITYGA